MADPASTLAATITGRDRPGLLARLADAIGLTGAEVLDLEQSVVRGQVSIGVLLGIPEVGLDTLEDRLAGACARLGLQVQMAEGQGDNRPRRGSSPSMAGTSTAAGGCRARR